MNEVNRVQLPPMSTNWSSIWEQSKPPLWARGLSALYTAGWRAYESVYRMGIKRRKNLPIPVIGVGSLLVGGASKTPTSIAIARLLKSRGMRPVVLCSGYGGKRWQEATPLLPNKEYSPAEIGEEPLEILNALTDTPVVVGKRRVLTAQTALEHFQPDALVLDDGFQHLPLARSVDLILLPARLPIGNGYCLPAGPLREPLSGLLRASAILFIDQSFQISSPAEMPSLQSKLPQFLAKACLDQLKDGFTQQAIPIEQAKTRPLIALSGIARPERFVESLKVLGITPLETAVFPDHHAYNSHDLQPYLGKTILSTEKDAIKLRPLLEGKAQLWTLSYRIELPEAFNLWLLDNLL